VTQRAVIEVSAHAQTARRARVALVIICSTLTERGHADVHKDKERIAKLVHRLHSDCLQGGGVDDKRAIGTALRRNSACRTVKASRTKAAIAVAAA
jgi:hypothetical protein